MEPCPHCEKRTLGWRDLATLSPDTPWICPACDGWVITSPLRYWLPFVAGILVAAVPTALVLRRFDAAWLKYGIWFFPLLGFLMVESGRALFARPTAWAFTSRPCAECKREDVGYYQYSNRVCADCTERLEQERIGAARRGSQ